MSEDFAAVAAEVAEALGEVGSTAYLVNTTTSGGTAFNPGTPTEAETSVTAVITEYSAREIDGTVIQHGDRKALVSAPAGVSIPTTNTKLRFKPSGGDEDFQIINVMPIQPQGPGGAVVVFEMQVRK